MIYGHVDAGKSGRLMFELGGMEKEADALGKSSFAFAFYMDRQMDNRERGVTIASTCREFFTETKHYTIIDSPGRRDFIKDMVTGMSQADVALLMVPADGNFVTSIAKGNLKAGEVHGETREHALLINLLGVKQLIVGVNKYGEERYDEISNEMLSMLTKVGWGRRNSSRIACQCCPFRPGLATI